MSRLTLPREFYIPKGAAAYRPKGLEAVVYFYNDPHKQNRPTAKAFSGKKAKPDWFVTFQSEERRAAYVKNWEDGLRAHQARKEEERQAKASYQHTFQVGDILYNSWGYDQTNIDWYEVTAVRGKQIVIREIAGKVADAPGYSPMSGMTVPCPGQYVGPEITKRPTGYLHNGVWNESVSFDHGCGSRWDGKPKYCSWYG